MINSVVLTSCLVTKIVADTSVIINGYITKQLESRLIRDELVIPVAALDELQAQASQGKEQGFVGLEEIKKIQKIGRAHV